MSRQKELRQEFVDKILAQIEAGTAFWQRPWELRNVRLPYNAATGKRYRGCNIAYLLGSALDKGFADNRWASYQQAQAKGWQVRKGERGSRVEFWGFREPKDDDETQNDRPAPFAKIYSVFNAQQMDGIEPLATPEPKPFEANENAESILTNCGVPIAYGFDRACYIPSKDAIRLPDKSQFKDEASFYAIAIHELAHATGHASRLNRDLAGGFGSAKYAKEELKAEMASALMMVELGLMPTVEGYQEHAEKHAGYVQSWLKTLKEDVNEFFKAVQDAEKIADYLLSFAASAQAVA